MESLIPRQTPKGLVWIHVYPQARGLVEIALNMRIKQCFDRCLNTMAETNAKIEG